jgi:hypothetical protein
MPSTATRSQRNTAPIATYIICYTFCLLQVFGRIRDSETRRSMNECLSPQIVARRALRNSEHKGRSVWGQHCSAPNSLALGGIVLVRSSGSYQFCVKDCEAKLAAKLALTKMVHFEQTRVPYTLPVRRWYENPRPIDQTPIATRRWQMGTLRHLRG